MFQTRSFVLICAVFIMGLALCGQAFAGYSVAAATNGNNNTHMFTPMPRPTPKPTPKPAPIPAPWNVRPVQSKHDCASALSLVAGICDAVVKTGGLQLLWNDRATTLDGYKIYRGSGDSRKLVLTLSNGPSPKYGAISKPSGGYDHACYAVTAYIGSRESAPSPAYCVQPGATAQTTTFAPAHVRSYVSLSYPALLDPNNNSGQLPLSTDLAKLQSTGFNTLLPSQVANSAHGASISGTAYVGYQSGYVKSPVPNNGEFYSGTDQGWVTIRSRAGYDFNLGKLTNHKVYSAILTLNVSQTARDNKYHSHFDLSDYSCTDRYLLGKDFWWSQSGALNNASTSAEIGQGKGPVVTVDVTKTVSDWAAGVSDYGFVLSNALADATGAKPMYPDLGCFTKYYNAQLKVVYF
jgi:hypothetical protein